MIIVTNLYSQLLDNYTVYHMVSDNILNEYNGQLNPESRIEITSSLINSPEYELFIKKPFSHRRLLKQKTYQTGDTLSFFVRDLFDQPNWEKVLSKLIFDTTTVSIWIETKSLDSLVNEDELSMIVEKFKSYLFHQSGIYSIDNASGIFSIMWQYFGNPPNVDGDGKLDILLLDVRDGFLLTGSYVAGFFDPNDLTGSATSNKRDLIYIDLYPTIVYEGELTVQNAIPTLAHEYQHLIHSNYEGPEREYIFINEGLSELAEIVCGFIPRSPNDHFNSPTRPLLSWNPDDPLPDYSRASLWTHYLFEQVGYENIQSLVQSPLTGPAEYERICNRYSNISFNRMFVNWTIANVINDVGVSPHYGYHHPLRQAIFQPVNRVEEQLPAVGLTEVGMLGSYPILVPLVKEVQLLSQSSGIDIYTIVTYPDGSVTIQTNNQNPAIANLSGNRHGSAVYLASNLNHPDSEDDSGIQTLRYIVTGEKSGIPEMLSYDDGIPDVFYNQASYLLVEGQEAIAIRYTLDKPVWLKSIEVNTIFLNEVQGTGISQSEPRDLIIRIAEDKNGKPGDLLVPNHYHRFTRPFGNLKPEKISLRDYYETLSTLEGSVFIILKNDNDDLNYFAIGLDSLTEGTETQFYYNVNGSVSLSWQTFDKVPIGNETLNGWNAMCRAVVVPGMKYLPELKIQPQFTYGFSEVTLEASLPFTVDTIYSGIAAVLPSGRFIRPQPSFNYPMISTALPLEIDGAYEIYFHLVSDTKTEALDTVFTWSVPLPEGFQVSQNYPNPFNSATSLPLLVIESGVVEIQVFDILGREILNLRPVTVEPGLHSARLNLNHLSSGIYFARINYSRLRDNRKNEDIVKMTLVK